MTKSARLWDRRPSEPRRLCRVVLRRLREVVVLPRALVRLLRLESRLVLRHLAVVVVVVVVVVVRLVRRWRRLLFVRRRSRRVECQAATMTLLRHVLVYVGRVDVVLEACLPCRVRLPIYIRQIATCLSRDGVACCPSILGKRRHEVRRRRTCKHLVHGCDVGRRELDAQCNLGNVAPVRLLPVLVESVLTTMTPRLKMKRLRLGRLAVIGNLEKLNRKKVVQPLAVHRLPGCSVWEKTAHCP